MSAQPPPEIVPDRIRDHVRLIHALAAPLAGKGVVVVTGFGADPDEIDPKTGKPGRPLRPKVMLRSVRSKKPSRPSLSS